MYAGACQVMVLKDAGKQTEQMQVYWMAICTQLRCMIVVWSLGDHMYVSK